jgi:hypothetical protein
MITRDGGLVVTGYITTTDQDDKYATNIDNLGKGGVHSVESLEDRDAISVDRRSRGMLCYVNDNASMYQLVSGIENVNWSLLYDISGGIIEFNIDCPEDYILVGDAENKLYASPALLDVKLDLIEMRKGDVIIGHKNHKFPNAQVLNDLDNGLLYTTEGIVDTYDVLPFEKLPNLGRSTNPLVLFGGKIWRGTLSDRPEESDDLSSVEVSVDVLKFVTIPGIQADIAAIQLELIAVESALAATTASVLVLQGEIVDIELTLENHDSRLINHGDRLDAAESRLDTHATRLDNIDIRIDDLRINTLLADADIDVYNFKIINLADAVNDQDAVNLRTLETYIGGLPSSITLEGDVTGAGNTGGIVTTTLTLTLDTINIAQGAVNLNNQLISFVADPIDDQDVVNLRTLNAQIDAVDRDITLEGDVTGSGLTGSIVTTTLTLTLDTINIAQGAVNLNNQLITFAADPVNDQDVVNLRTLTTQIATVDTDITLDGDVTGSGTTGSVITTTLTLTLDTINIAQDTVNLNNQLITFAADPVNEQDVVNLRTLETYIGGVPSAITLEGDVSGIGDTGGVVITTLELTLDQIKVAENTVNLNNQKIDNLNSDTVEEKNAINAQFIWELMHDEIEVNWL